MDRENSLLKSLSRKKKITKLKRNILIWIILIIGVGFLFLLQVEKRLLPAAISTSEIKIKNNLNIIISKVINDVIAKNRVDTNSFYSITLDNTGKLDSLSVNSILLNNLCNEMSVRIAQEVENINDSDFAIPLGSLIGLDSLANIGPRYAIKILPAAQASVDYESSFSAEGINQISFQLWLNVQVVARIVNPLDNTDIRVSKKAAMVNTVISGSVPDTYLNFR
jgi:sporulation protein YunB